MKCPRCGSYIKVVRIDGSAIYTECSQCGYSETKELKPQYVPGVRKESTTA